MVYIHSLFLAHIGKLFQHFHQKYGRLSLFNGLLSVAIGHRPRPVTDECYFYLAKPIASLLLYLGVLPYARFKIARTHVGDKLCGVDELVALGDRILRGELWIHALTDYPQK